MSEMKRNMLRRRIDEKLDDYVEKIDVILM